MDSMHKSIISVVGGVVVSLVLGVGGVSLGPAVAGTLEPPADALQGGAGSPSPTTQRGECAFRLDYYLFASND